jgi:hypothetical protein
MRENRGNREIHEIREKSRPVPPKAFCVRVFRVVRGSKIPWAKISDFITLRLFPQKNRVICLDSMTYETSQTPFWSCDVGCLYISCSMRDFTGIHCVDNVLIVNEL